MASYKCHCVEFIIILKVIFTLSKKFVYPSPLHLQLCGLPLSQSINVIEDK